MKVVLSYYPGDQQLAANLSKWICELGSNKGHSVLLVRDIRCNPNIDREIKHNFEQAFDSVEVIDVTEQVDGWPKAPNLAFGKAAKHIQYTSQDSWLWIEPDVVPIKPGWVEALAKEYAACGKPFLGDFVNVENVIPHMSGIGCYENQITDHAGRATVSDDIAFDVFAADQIVPNMAQTRLISHKWKFPRLNNQSEVDNLLGQLGDAVLFHQDKTGSLINFLRERRNPPPTQQNVVAKRPEAGIGTCDIFIKTYPQDYPWLEWCLHSIHKFVSGVRNVRILVPESEAVIAKDKNNIADWTIIEEYGNDNYLSQQVFKLYADTFTDADHILYVDSDTIFTQPVTPETYFKNGKFLWMMTPIDQAHPNEQQAWRRVMEKFLGKPPEFEWMRRFPFVLPRWLLSEVRTFCLRQHGVELKDYVMAQPYREFSEFNCLGFYAYEYHRDKFEWFDTSKHPESEWPVLTVDQQWSHGKIPVEKWEQILASGHGDNKKLEVDLARLTPNQSPKRTSQSNLGSEDNKRSEQNTLNGSPDPSLPYLLAEIAKHFKSPLAKGRIFKSLKAFPIVK